MQRGLFQVHYLCVQWHYKLEVGLISPSPKSNNLTSLSSMTFPIHMTYHLVIVIPISPQLTPYIHQSPQLPPLLMSQLGPHVLIFTLYGWNSSWESYHYSLKDLCDEVVHHVPPSNPYQVWPPPAKDSMGNKELTCNHIWERMHRTHNPGMPQTKDALQSLSQSSHILEPEDSDSEDSLSLCPDDSVNDTEFEDSLHEFTQSPSIEDPMFSELVTVIPLKCHHMMMTLSPTLVNVTYLMIIHHHPMIGSKMSLNLASVRSLTHH